MDYYHAPKRQFHPNHSERDKKPYTAVSNRANYSQFCEFCKARHFSFKCPTYLAKDQKGREKMVRDQKLCVNCLRPGHFSRDCGSGKCNRCDAKHNSTLCPANPFANQANCATMSKVKRKKNKPRDNQK